MRLAVGVALVLQMCVSAIAAAPVDDRIQGWVRQLDDDRFHVREQATARLVDAGTLAVSAVVKAMESPHPETCSRANLIIKRWIKAGDLSTVDALDMALRFDETLAPNVVVRIQDAIQEVNLLWLKRVGAELEDVRSGFEGFGAELEDADARRQVRYVSLVAAKITDADLIHLRGLKSLETLHLSGTNISDAGLFHLKDVKSLKQLHVDGTNITDAGLVHLTKHTSLTHLNLAKTEVTDVGLAQLKRLRSLKVLNINSTKISDRGFAQLHGLTSLEMLHFQDTSITVAGLVPLKRALPKLATMPMFLGLDRADLGPDSKRFK